MTTPSASHAESAGSASFTPDREGARTVRGRDVCFWYQGLRMAPASPSCRYRMGHLAEFLRGATIMLDRRARPRVFRHARALVVVRPYLDGGAIRALETCRRRGTRLIADFDDLLFGGSPEESPRVRSGMVDRSECAARIARYREGLTHFSAFTVATPSLAEHLCSVVPGARVAVVPNGVSPRWVEQGRKLYPAWRPGDPKVIRYLCGTPSHDADFAVVTEVLGRFMGEHDDVSLEIIGPLRFSNERLPADRVSNVSVIPFAELPRFLAASWVTLAPLAETEFNRCKSAIKFLESAAFGTPCVASPNSDMERHADGGVILARDSQQWHDALTRLRDDEYRLSLGQRGRAYVDRHGTAREAAHALTECIERWDLEQTQN